MINHLNEKYPCNFSFKISSLQGVSKRRRLALFAEVVPDHPFLIFQYSVSYKVYRAHRSYKGSLLKVLFEHFAAFRPALEILGVPISEMIKCLR